MRLIFGTEAADLASAQQQILRAFHGKSLSFENYNNMEAACLSTLQIVETYIPKRSQLDAPDEELAEKRYKGSCFAYGRQGHRKQDCSFLEQGHPDANNENTPWPESTNGKAWALKGKSSLPGNITLSGETFNYQVNRK